MRSDAASLGRALSRVEARGPRKSAAYACKALRIGITGSQGAGKSTLIEALAKRMRADKKRVAILAVDPSSPRSGGAFLGDRMRMQSLAEDTGVFIRSMASRGAHGGVADATPEAVRLCCLAGYDYVLVETVGAGQLDCAVSAFTDLTVLVVTPESGDEFQFMKGGLSEMAGCFVINKSDRPGAEKMRRSLPRGPVFQTVAQEGKGVDALYGFLIQKNRS